MRKKLVGTCVAVGAFTALSPGAALAQQQGTFTVSPSTVPAGGQVEVSGECPGGAGGEDRIAIIAGEGFAEPGQLGEVPVEEDGAFTGTITIPAGAPPATGEITAQCPTGGAGNVLTAMLTITAADDGGRDEVPDGGVDAGVGGSDGVDPAAVVLGASGALLVAGGTLLAVRRRRA